MPAGLPTKGRPCRPPSGLKSKTPRRWRRKVRLETLLEVRDLVRHFPVKRSRTAAAVRAVDGVSFTVAEGETVGLVGESGCGKSSLGKLIVGIDNPTSGSITYEGKEVAGIRGRALARYNSDVQMVFQNPMSSLNPRMTVGDMINEPRVTTG